MEHFLEVVAESLRNAGFDARADYGRLAVDGLNFSVWPHRSPRRIQFCGEYIPIRGRQFDVALAVQAFVRSYPRRLAEHRREEARREEARKRRTGAEQREAERRELDAECNAIVAQYNGERRTLTATGPEVAPGVHFAYIGNGEFAVFSTFKDGGQALVACDYLSEMSEQR